MERIKETRFELKVDIESVYMTSGPNLLSFRQASQKWMWAGAIRGTRQDLAVD